jgi:membrane fusion protein (multidrug efflux system)
VSRRQLLLLGGALGVVLLAVVLRASLAGGGGGGEARGASRPGENAALRAQGAIAAVTDLAETARAVGTLHANESVQIVPELSRRLVRAHVAEGARVEKGELLFELDSSDLRASLDELQARRDMAANTVERQRELMREEARALSGQDRDQALADLRAIEAQLEGVRVTLAKTQIRAPFAGTVGLRRASEGAWVTPETLLTTLQDTSRIKIDFSLPERFAGELAVGQEVSFRSSGGAEAWTARVLAIEPLIQASTRSLLVRALCDNPGDALFPGAFVSVEVPLRRAGSGVMVPATALVPSAEGHAVWRLREGKAELVPVELGVRTPDQVQLLRGIEPGETVLVTNLLRMRPGVAVELASGGAAR